MTDDIDIFREESTPHHAEPAGPSFGSVMFGMLLIAAGLTWLLSALDVVDLSWRTIMSGALILVGVALIVGSTQGSHGGLVTTGVILAVVLGLASTAEGVLDVPFSGGIGDSTYTPTTATALDSPYRLAIGDLTVDLSTLELSSGVTEVEASVAIGQLTVRLPADVAVEVTGSVGAGRLVIDRTEYSGTGVDELVTDPGFADADRRLRLRVRVGLGDAEVRR
jgi:hypothetical protein